MLAGPSEACEPMRRLEMLPFFGTDMPVRIRGDHVEKNRKKCSRPADLLESLKIGPNQSGRLETTGPGSWLNPL